MTVIKELKQDFGIVNEDVGAVYALTITSTKPQTPKKIHYQPTKPGNGEGGWLGELKFSWIRLSELILGCKMAQQGFHEVSFWFNLIPHDSWQVGKMTSKTPLKKKNPIKSSDTDGHIQALITLPKLNSSRPGKLIQPYGEDFLLQHSSEIIG